MFGEQCATMIKLECVKLRKWYNEYSTKLCYFRGVHIPLFNNKSGEELTPVEVKVITELVEFAMPVTGLNYRQSKHGSKHKGLVRLTTWVKRWIPKVILDEDPLKNCTISFDGFRVLLFGFCARVFAHVKNKLNVQQQSFHSQLGSIYTAYLAN